LIAEFENLLARYVVMIDTIRSFGTRRGAVAAAVCGLLLALPVVAAAQTVVPTTACDAALANPDLHPLPEMPLEDGTKAFSYTAEGPFVSGGGAFLSITVALTFQPGPDATIRLSALDEACAGSGGSGTVFTYTFAELTSARNAISYNAAEAEITFNGAVQKASPQGTPRYLFVDVWDGALPSARATYSYVIDLLNPTNPTTP
jgi:hypothetical protein